MPTYESLGRPQESPTAPLEQLTHWLVTTAGELALAVVIGVGLAAVLRARNAHWSWAPAGLALLVPAAPLLRCSSTTLWVATLCAARWGWRWHRADVDGGKDLAAMAAARKGPWQMGRRLLDVVALRRRTGPATTGWFRGGEMIVGQDRRGGLVSIPCGGRGGGTHTLVLGATGSGKTKTQSWIAARAIEHGMGAVVIDPKGDWDLRDALLRVASETGRPSFEWSPDGPCVYNPYARGSDTAIADKLLAGERFTEPHYLRQAQRYLGHVARALREAELEVSLARIVEHLDPSSLERLVRTLAEPQARPTQDYLDSLTPRQRVDLAGVRDRLAIVVESDVGPWLDPVTENARQFDLHDAVTARGVTYFNLDSDSRPLLAQMLGAAIVQDLQSTVASLQGQPVPTLVVIDEFSALAVEHVARLFGRARSAGFSVVLGTQELADMHIPGHEKLLEQVMGNLTTVIAHRQVMPESSALVTGLAGTRGAWRVSRHSDGRTTRTRTREGVLSPDEVMSLRPGWAAVMVLTSPADARIARILSS